MGTYPALYHWISQLTWTVSARQDSLGNFTREGTWSATAVALRVSLLFNKICLYEAFGDFARLRGGKGLTIS